MARLSARPLAMTMTATKPMPWRRLGAPLRLTSNWNAKRGVRKEKGFSSASATTRPSATARARRRILRRRSRSARSAGISSDIGEDADEPDPEPTDRIHYTVGASIDDDIGLGSKAKTRHVFFSIQFNPHREPLRFANPTRLVLDAGHLTELGAAVIGDAPPDALDFAGEDLAGQRIEHDVDRGAGSDVLQAVLAEARHNPV